MQTFSPQQYLMIDIASNFGLDKVSWNERISWFSTNEPHLEELITAAKEPALYYAGVKAWRDVQAKKPIGYMISLDGTSSGLQILAALTGDRKAASICNVVNSGKREDAYKRVYQEMLKRLGETSKISHDDTKQAIMCSLYGSTAMPKQVFGEGALLDKFYNVMNDMAPAAWEMNQAYLALWNPDALSNDWVMPDNFHVHIKVMAQAKQTVHFLNEPFDVFYQVNAPMEEGRSLAANQTHSVDGMMVREITRRCDYDPKMVENLRDIMAKYEKKSLQGYTITKDDHLMVTLWNHYNNSGYLSARILDTLNADNIGYVNLVAITELLDSLPKKPFKVVSIHDCFRCLPTYGNDLRMQYNNQLMLIARSNLLSYLLSQLVGKQINIGKLDPTLHKDIMGANYALS